jgi:zinc transporter ZupT
LGLFFLTGLSGLLFYFLSGTILEKIKSPGLHIALGTLAGSIIFHLIPDYFSHSESGGVHFLLLFLAGFGFMIFISRLKKDKNTHKSGVTALFLGDSIHNSITSFLWVSVSMAAGNPVYSLVPALLLHEIPHKLGNFSIMLFSGLSQTKSLLLSVISASFFFSGIVLRFISFTPDMRLFLPLVSGLLSYSLISGIKSKSIVYRGFSRWIWLFAGFVLMGIISLLFKDLH